MAETAISIRQVNKTFHATHAVRDLDLEVPAGSLCGFLGPNGAGKSTTIRMIMSIIYPDTGSIRVLGGSALASKDRIGYLPEERGLYRKMRVAEFLEYIGRLKGRSGPGLKRDVRDWLERVQLAEVRKVRCQELSKGMQQKVQFLAAIINDPELLILDEPFSGLDPVNTALISDLIRQLHVQGKTIIFSTHVLSQAEELCERFFLINHGNKLLDARLAEIRERFDPRTIVCEPLEEGLDLERIEGVRAARPAEGLGRAGLELELEPGSDLQGVMRAVLAAGPVRAIALTQPTLNEVFVLLVQEDEGRAAAERAREELSHV